jgi:UDP-N-acetylmuramate dehydrogenase
MINIKSQVPLAPLTTFQIGGEAKYFVEVKTEAELREAIFWAREQGVRFALLAGGSNVLVNDTGFDGLLIHIVPGEWQLDDVGVLTADAGCNLLALIRAAGERGWGGWEKMAGIPGTIGGAARGNAGAFGTEIKDIEVHADAFNVETGESRSFTNSECEFSYRQSFFKQHPEWVITKVAVQLVQVDPAESSGLIEGTIAEREKRHLQNVRAAGSYFMNPVAPPELVLQFETEKQVKSREGRVPAGWLIEKAGMKGFAVGGAQSSLQHPNYVVNNGTATATDVKAVAAAVIKAVEEKFGITLHEEAVVW